MKKYRLTFYEDGVQKTQIVTANSSDEALRKGWCMFDADDMYVSEIND